MNTDHARSGARILGVHVDALTWNEVQSRILCWAKDRQSRYVSVCNVHSLVTARRQAQFGTVLRQADLTTPDGMPLVWCLRKRGFPRQERIDGPELMHRLCRLAAVHGISVFLYGGTSDGLERLERRLRADMPQLRIAGRWAPPFRSLTADEQRDAAKRINDSGAGIVFVGLGCPKQEIWMHANRCLVAGVMIGVGAAFDFHAGLVRRAPPWMRRNGLEWLYRLASDPRRLWRRYLVTNSAFIVHLAAERLAAIAHRTVGGNKPSGH